MRRLFIALIIALIGFNAEADVTLIHINGVATSYPEASRNHDELEKWAIENNVPDLADVEFVHNNDEWFMLTYLEAAAQVSQEAVISVSKSFVKWIYGDSAQTNQHLDDAFDSAAQHVTELGTLNNDELNNVLKKINKHTENGEKVILVPHSQGNLFANYALREIQGTNSLAIDSSAVGVVHVASPSIDEFGHRTTVANDLIVGGGEFVNSAYTIDFRDIVTKIGMRAYVWDLNQIYRNEIENSLDRTKHHAFIGEYLNGDESREDIFLAIKELANELKTPGAEIPPVAEVSIVAEWLYAPICSGDFYDVLFCSTSEVGVYIYGPDWMADTNLTEEERLEKKESVNGYLPSYTLLLRLGQTQEPVLSHFNAEMKPGVYEIYSAYRVPMPESYSERVDDAVVEITIASPGMYASPASDFETIASPVSQEALETGRKALHIGNILVYDLGGGQTRVEYLSAI